MCSVAPQTKHVRDALLFTSNRGEVKKKEEKKRKTQKGANGQRHCASVLTVSYCNILVLLRAQVKIRQTLGERN